MENEHHLDQEALAIIRFALAHHHHWIVYNTIPYHLKKEDINFFRKKDEAEEYCANNTSEFDNYIAVRADSLEQVIQAISGQENLAEVRKQRTRGEMDDLDMARGKGTRL